LRSLHRVSLAEYTGSVVTNSFLGIGVSMLQKFYQHYLLPSSQLLLHYRCIGSALIAFSQ